MAFKYPDGFLQELLYIAISYVRTNIIRVH